MKDYVKIWELDSNNRDVDRDSDESGIDKSLDSLRPIEILSMHSWPRTVAPPHFFFISFLRLATLAFVSFFVFPHFPRVTSFKKNRATEKLSLPLRRLERIEKHKCFLDILFTRTSTIVNFPCTDWLSYLRTQLKAFVGGVCLQTRRFFLALFSRIIIFAWSTHFKEL